MLDKSIREIERERQSLQAQEKKLITEIKKTAKQGQMVIDGPNSLGKRFVPISSFIPMFGALDLYDIQNIYLELKASEVFDSL